MLEEDYIAEKRIQKCIRDTSIKSGWVVPKKKNRKLTRIKIYKTDIDYFIEDCVIDNEIIYY